jgi:hypothetical protein
MSTWSPITESEMQRLLDEQLASCSEAEREAYARVRTPLRHVPFQRGQTVESVFSLAQHGEDLLIFDDVEYGFEWCRPDSDGVIRSYSCSQGGIQARLYELLHHERA